MLEYLTIFLFISYTVNRLDSTNKRISKLTKEIALNNVSKDQIVCIIECMKMEIPILAPVAGELSKWLVSSEDIVSEGQVIGILTAEE